MTDGEDSSDSASGDEENTNNDEGGIGVLDPASMKRKSEEELEVEEAPTLPAPARPLGAVEVPIIGGRYLTPLLSL